MMMTIKKSDIALIFLFIFFYQGKLLTAQQNDFEIWTAFSVRKKIDKNLLVDLEEGIRFNQNSLSFKKSFTDLGLKYRINKFVDIRGNYRFEQRNLYYDRLSLKHRFNLDIILKKDIKRFETSFRTRYQIKFSDNADSDGRPVPDQYLRSRFKFEYDIAKSSVQPEFSAELYHGLNDENLLIHQRSRYTIGVSLQLSERLNAGAYYRIQKEINIPDPLSSYILGLKAHYDLN